MKSAQKALKFYMHTHETLLKPNISENSPKVLLFIHIIVYMIEHAHSRRQNFDEKKCEEVCAWTNCQQESCSFMNKEVLWKISDWLVKNSVRYDDDKKADRPLPYGKNDLTPNSRSVSLASSIMKKHKPIFSTIYANVQKLF